MRLLIAFALVLTLSLGARAATTTCCHFDYTSSEGLNRMLDKVDAALCAAYVNCNTATPKFVVTTTTTTTSTTTTSTTTT